MSSSLQTRPDDHVEPSEALPEGTPPLPADISESLPMPPALVESDLTLGLEQFPTIQWSLAEPSGEETSESAATPGAAFLLKKMVNRGGQGEVWEAVQTSLGRTVALKRIRRDLISPPGVNVTFERGRKALFRQEAVTTARLDHPNIVPVHDMGISEDGSPLMAMKLVNGRSWDTIINEEFDMMPAPDFLARHLPILIQVCQAVSFAHSRSIVHRDLKPSQVMIGEYGEVMLVDWGQAIFVGDEASTGRQSGAPSRKTACNPSGTVAFMAPEQTLDSAEGIGPWTDVYLLGGILYFLLTRHAPHEAMLAQVAFYRARRGEVPHPESVAPDRELPNELVDLCLSAMKPKAEERTASAKDFIEQLQDYLSGAGHRRQSVQIVEQVRKRLESAAPVYELYSEGAGNLSRAIELWPDNEGARRLRQDIHARHATLALRNKDLKLARLQAEFLEDGQQRSELMAEITSQERRATIYDYQRCWFIRISIALGVAFFFLFLHAYKQRLAVLEENERLQEELWTAQKHSGATRGSQNEP